MGLEDDFKSVENAVDGQTAANQDQTNPSDAKWDTVVDSVVDEIANKEGVSAAVDPEINNFVNDEVNKF